VLWRRCTTRQIWAFSLESAEQGLKRRTLKTIVSARLKSCPDTKPILPTFEYYNFLSGEKRVADGPGFLFLGMYFYYGEVAEMICKFEREICVEKKGVGRYFLWEGLTGVEIEERQRQKQLQILHSVQDDSQ
jgi:hypothetical protein